MPGPKCRQTHRWKGGAPRMRASRTRRPLPQSEWQLRIETGPSLRRQCRPSQQVRTRRRRLPREARGEAATLSRRAEIHSRTRMKGAKAIPDRESSRSPSSPFRATGKGKRRSLQLRLLRQSIVASRRAEQIESRTGETGLNQTAQQIDARPRNRPCCSAQLIWIRPPKQSALEGLRRAESPGEHAGVLHDQASEYCRPSCCS